MGQVGFEKIHRASFGACCIHTQASRASLCSDSSRSCFCWFTVIIFDKLNVIFIQSEYRKSCISAMLCYWRPRNPKNCVNMYQTVWISVSGSLVPNFPAFHRSSSSDVVNGFDAFGLLPLPFYLNWAAWPFNSKFEEWNSVPRTIDVG